MRVQFDIHFDCDEAWIRPDGRLMIDYELGISALVYAGEVISKGIVGSTGIRIPNVSYLATFTVVCQNVRR